MPLGHTLLRWFGHSDTQEPWFEGLQEAKRIRDAGWEEARERSKELLAGLTEQVESRYVAKVANILAEIKADNPRDK